MFCVEILQNALLSKGSMHFIIIFESYFQKGPMESLPDELHAAQSGFFLLGGYIIFPQGKQPLLATTTVAH